jgi:hypothetical protein
MNSRTVRTFRVFSELSKESSGSDALVRLARLGLAVLVFFLSAHSFSVNQLRLGWAPDSSASIEKRTPLHHSVSNPLKLSAFTAENNAPDVGAVWAVVSEPIFLVERSLVDAAFSSFASGGPPSRSLLLPLRI